MNTNHTMKDLFAALDPMSLMNLSHQKSTLVSFQSKEQENRDRADQDSKTMADLNSTVSLYPNHTIEDLFEALDPMSLINLSQDPTISLQSKQQQQYIVTSFTLERGPRYKAYAELRELKLQMKLQPQKQLQHHQQRLPIQAESIRTPPTIKKTARSSIVGRSVPDFSSVLRKENRKPMMEMTPPTSKGRMEAKSELRGSKSASGAEKRVGGGNMMAIRKSNANMEELQGLSLGVANAINGEGRKAKNVGGGYNRSVLGSRQYGY